MSMTHLSEKQIEALKLLKGKRFGLQTTQGKTNGGSHHDLTKGLAVNCNTAYSLEDWGLVNVTSGGDRVMLKPYVEQIMDIEIGNKSIRIKELEEQLEEAQEEYNYLLDEFPEEE